jgi:hypothetical protein
MRTMNYDDARHEFGSDDITAAERRVLATHRRLADLYEAEHELQAQIAAALDANDSAENELQQEIVRCAAAFGFTVEV